MMQVTAGSALQNGKYILNQMLHQFGPEVSFKAAQVNLNQAVVVKTLQPNLQVPVDVAVVKPPFLEAVRRFVQCHHPHLVRILDGFKEKDQPFIVLEYIAGQSFAERIQAGGSFPEERAIAYVRQVGEALSVMHSKGLIHSNVSPTTILRRPKTHAVVLDGIEFLAILNPSDVPPEAQPSRSSTDSYLALEQVQPATPLTRPAPTSDIYGLAATLYYLVTGQAPTPAVEREQGKVLPTPRQLKPGLTARLEAAILNGMQIHAQYRPHSMAAWLDLLPSPGKVAEPVPPIAVAPPPQPIELTPVSPVVDPSGGNEATPIASNGHPPVEATSTQATLAVARSPEPDKLPVIAQSPKKVGPAKSGRKPWKQAIILTGAIAASAGLGIGLALRLGGSAVPGTSLFQTEQSFPRQPDWPGEGDAATVPDVNQPGRAPEVTVPENPILKPPSATLPDTRPILPPTLPVQPSPEPPAEPVAPPVTSSQPEVQTPVITPPSPPVSEPAPVELPPPPTSAPPPPGNNAAPASTPPVSEPQP